MATNDRMRFLFEELHGHAVWLRQKWLLYQQLYGDRRRVDVMRAAALVSFGILQSVLQESIFLAIARFLDRPKSAGNATASLEQLLKAIPRGHDALCADLTDRLANLRTTCAPIRQWRNNRIAHASLAVAMMEKVVEGVTIRSVAEAVAGIEDFHRQIGHHFYPSESWAVVGEPVDADTLMFLLEEGLKQHPSVLFPIRSPSASDV